MNGSREGDGEIKKCTNREVAVVSSAHCLLVLLKKILLEVILESKLHLVCRILETLFLNSVLVFSQTNKLFIHVKCSPNQAP